MRLMTDETNQVTSNKLLNQTQSNAALNISIGVVAEAHRWWAMAQADVLRSLGFPAAPSPSGQTRRSPARNVIFFIGDGLGITTVSNTIVRQLLHECHARILIETHTQAHTYTHTHTHLRMNGILLSVRTVDGGARAEGDARGKPRGRGGSRARLVRTHRTRQGVHL